MPANTPWSTDVRLSYVITFFPQASAAFAPFVDRLHYGGD
jgi:hypothetical protein